MRHLLLLLALLFFSSGCSTGRVPVSPGVIPQGSYVSAEDEIYGQRVFGMLNSKYPVSRDDDAIERVRGLVQRLAKAGNVDGHPWNVFVLQGDNVVNAAATRGNYVFVWTGMLNMAKSDGQLATVLAHEIGHLLANHTKQTPAEEASQIMAQAGGEIAGRIIAMQPGYAPLAQLAGVLVTEAIKAIAVNPGSQQLEMEADHIGYFLMADAGFNPEEALEVWAMMAGDESRGDGALQFLSSHPASAERLEALRALLPEAKERHKRATTKSKRSKKSVNNNPAPKDPPPSASKQPAQEDDSFAVN
jgi:predicted Zn-dependent protease